MHTTTDSAGAGQTVHTVQWIPDREGELVPGRVRILDQTALPTEVRYVETDALEEVREAICRLRVRGAPAIGVTAAMGVAVAVQDEDAESGRELVRRVAHAADRLASARPTAVNLRWATERMKRIASENDSLSVSALKRRLVEEALRIQDEDAGMCRAIGEFAVGLLKQGQAVITHCNTGRLATCGIGTALAPVYVAAERGLSIPVYADETRPALQGARLTAWELSRAGIEVTLVCDGAAAKSIADGRVQAALVGADRIAANGDTANKIGTYGLALAARQHGVPFYVLAPTSTFDPDTPTGNDIPIEERSAEEVTRGFGRQTAPDGVRVYSPAFDVTPASLITAIVCEKGVLRPPYPKALADAVNRS